MKIDKRKKYFLVLDVEGAGELDCAFVYDVGGAVVDKRGNIYDSFSFAVSDIFENEPFGILETAYYANKLPLYYEKIKSGEMNVKSLYYVREHIKSLISQYSIGEVMAYNAIYDRNALNNTQRWTTKSKYRYFLPYGVKVSCIWHMACQVICTQKSYKKFAIENGFVSAKGNIKTSAETVYAYMIDDPSFEEEHTGYEDVKIESEIMARCFRQHKKMNRYPSRWCWRIPQGKAV